MQQIDLTVQQVECVASYLYSLAVTYPLYTFAGVIVLGALLTVKCFPRVSDYK